MGEFYWDMADLRLDDADILIIDPDRNAANAVRYALQAYGYPDYRIGKNEDDLLRENASVIIRH